MAASHKFLPCCRLLSGLKRVACSLLCHVSLYRSYLKRPSHIGSKFQLFEIFFIILFVRLNWIFCLIQTPSLLAFAKRQLSINFIGIHNHTSHEHVAQDDTVDIMSHWGTIWEYIYIFIFVPPFVSSDWSLGISLYHYTCVNSLSFGTKHEIVGIFPFPRSSIKWGALKFSQFPLIL